MVTDRTTLLLYCAATGVAFLSALVGAMLTRVLRDPRAIAILKVLNARTRVWLAMCVVFALALATGGIGSVLMFAFASFLLLREFITITPTRPADHHVLFWVFFVVLPVQYLLLAIDWYGLFVVLIPVYAFLLIPIRMTCASDPRGFLERTAKMQWALMICVYCLSYAPALFQLKTQADPGCGGRLLLYLVLVSQVNDMVRILVDRTVGRHKAAPAISDEYTWEGLAAGLLASLATGAAMWPALPFTLPQAFAFAALIAAVGSAGVICLAAIKKDRGRDGVVVVTTRPTTMDRVISLCFAAPVFFHLVRYYLTDAPISLF